MAPAGLVIVKCDGQQMELSGENTKKNIDGIDGKDVVLFVRLKTGKTVEFVD